MDGFRDGLRHELRTLGRIQARKDKALPDKEASCIGHRRLLLTAGLHLLYSTLREVAIDTLGPLEVVAEVAQVAAAEPGETELQVVDQATGEVFARIPARVLAAVNVDDY